MSTSIFLGTELFLNASTPPEVFPTSSWAGATTKVPLQSDVQGQFGVCLLPGDAATCVAAQTHIWEDFLRINQDWLLKPHPKETMSPETPHCFTLRTLAEKYQVLTGMASGIGALAVVQWVVGTSNGVNQSTLNLSFWFKAPSWPLLNKESTSAMTLPNWAYLTINQFSPWERCGLQTACIHFSCPCFVTHASMMQTPSLGCGHGIGTPFTNLTMASTHVDRLW